MNDTADRLSDLERGVLFAMAEEDSEREILLRQIDTASVVNRDYTEVGLYTKLAVGADVPKLRTPNRSIEDYPKLSLVHPAPKPLVPAVEETVAARPSGLTPIAVARSAAWSVNSRAAVTSSSS